MTDEDHPPTTRGEVTRDAILAAALSEFADKGYSGARVKAIATRARCNVALIYHHFGNKEGLHRAVLESILEERVHALDRPVGSIAEALVRYHEGLTSEVDRIRMIEWEALAAGPAPDVSALVHADRRRAALHQRVDRIRELQRSGQLDPEVPAELLYLAIAGLAAYPVVFPQVTKMLTDLDATSPAFMERWQEMLQFLGGILDGALTASPVGEVSEQAVDGRDRAVR